MSVKESPETSLKDQELHLISLIGEQVELKGIPIHGPQSETNQVYFYPDVVLRIGGASLLHEVAVAPHVPKEVGYPDILGHGEVTSDDRAVNFMVMQRAEGLPFREAWPNMSQDERNRALGAVPLKTALIHNLQVDKVDWPAQAPHLPLAFGEGLFDGLNAVRFKDKLKDNTEAGWLDEDLAKKVSDSYDRLRLQADLPTKSKAVPYSVGNTPDAVCLHNDIGIYNLLWSPREQEVKLLDFELAGRGPREIDWFHFVRSLYAISEGNDPLKNVPDSLMEQLDQRSCTRMALFSLVRGVQIIDGWRTEIYEEGQSVFLEKQKLKSLYSHLEDEANGTGIFSHLLELVS